MGRGVVLQVMEVSKPVDLADVVARYLDTPTTETVARGLGLDVKTINILVSTPQFQAALRKQLQVELQGTAVAAIKTLRAVVESDTALPRDRASAAKALLAIAGYVAPKAQDQKHATASPSEMTIEDLRAFIGKAKAELAARAAPVNAQIEANPDTQVTDML